MYRKCDFMTCILACELNLFIHFPTYTLISKNVIKEKLVIFSSIQLPRILITEHFSENKAIIHLKA